MRRGLLPALLCLAAVTDTPAAVQRWYQPEHAAAGAPLFQRHCAACHGVSAEGADGWQRPGPDGRMPAPPLDGSAHAWHHPLKALVQTVMHGQEAMPGWRGVLTLAETLAIIAWFQSLWPEEVYLAWQRMDAAAADPVRP